jgi:hypothetical protein
VDDAKERAGVEREGDGPTRDEAPELALLAWPDPHSGGIPTAALDHRPEAIVFDCPHSVRPGGGILTGRRLSSAYCQVAWKSPVLRLSPFRLRSFGDGFRFHRPQACASAECQWQPSRASGEVSIQDSSSQEAGIGELEHFTDGALKRSDYNRLQDRQ